ERGVGGLDALHLPAADRRRRDGLRYIHSVERGPVGDTGVHHVESGDGGRRLGSARHSGDGRRRSYGQPDLALLVRDRRRRRACRFQELLRLRADLRGDLVRDRGRGLHIRAMLGVGNGEWGNWNSIFSKFPTPHSPLPTPYSLFPTPTTDSRSCSASTVPARLRPALAARAVEARGHFPRTRRRLSPRRSGPVAPPDRARSVYQSAIRRYHLRPGWRDARVQGDNEATAYSRALRRRPFD